MAYGFVLAKKKKWHMVKVLGRDMQGTPSASGKKYLLFYN